MNLRQIEFAVAVAEERSFTRAAQRCCIVQSALSHQVARLEKELGAVLFERNSRHVSLTPSGQAFLRQAYLTLEAARRIPDEVAAVSGEIRGQLALGTISALSNIDIVVLIARFHELYPCVDIRLNQSGSENLMALLDAGRLDLALVGLWPGQPIKGGNYQYLGEEHLLAILPPGHPMTGCKQLTLEMLATLPLADYPPDSSARCQTDKAFAAVGVSRQVSFEVDHVELIARLVAQGLAAGLVPSSVAATLSGVACVAVQNAPRRVLYAVWPRSPTPAALAVIALLQGLVDRGGLNNRAKS